jgi:methionyl-tRNA formyltransferase
MSDNKKIKIDSFGEIKNIVYMGTPDFAATILEKIVSAKYNVSLVVSQKDKPRGRGNVMSPSPVKAVALEKGISVITPDSIKSDDAVMTLEEIKPDIIIVAAYGQILPERILNLPKYGCVNVHASLLPKYRGAAPINRAIMDGEQEGGVTVMYMEKGLDTGDMLYVKKMSIPDDMDAGEYHDALSELGSEALLEFLDDFQNGKAYREKQDDSQATYAAKILKDELLIDFSLPAKKVVDFIRGTAPFPGSYFMLKGKRIKAMKAEVGASVGDVGTAKKNEKGIEIICGEGSVVITSLKPEGKRVMTGAEYLVGNEI